LNVDGTWNEVLVAQRAEANSVFAYEIVASGDRSPRSSRNWTRDHLNTGEIVNVDDSGCVLRMTERGEKVTEPKNFGDTVGECAELRNGSGPANQRAEAGAMENGGTIEETHVGNGALPARMVIYVAGIGVTNENIGAGMSPTIP
jgi:hypothetical protein